MLPCSRSLQFAEGDTILSCANILHVGAEAYGQLMPSFASGNNISEMGGKGKGGARENMSEAAIREGLVRQMKKRARKELMRKAESMREVWLLMKKTTTGGKRYR